MNKVLIVGGGLGGLVSSLYLSHAGYKVTLLEKNGYLGGKLSQIKEGGFTFDCGPTLLTMPFVLEDLFENLGKRIEDYLDLMPVDPLCRYFFSDGSQLDISNNMDKTYSYLEAFNPDEVQSFKKILNHGKRVYSIASKPFLFESNGSWGPKFFLTHWKSLLQFWKLDPFRTLSQMVSSTFKDERLKQVFNRFATYNGSSPYKTPATFSIIPYIEHTMGGWYPKGGMYKLVEVLEQFAVELGVEIRKEQVVKEILVEEGAVRGVELVDGSVLEAEKIIANTDALQVYKRLIPSSQLNKNLKELEKSNDMSTSGFVLQLGVKKEYPNLSHHNIFFSKDYKEEFEALFEQKIPAPEPTIYVSISKKSDATLAPDGTSNLFVLVNVPSISEGSKIDWDVEKYKYRDLIVHQLEIAGLSGLNSNICYEKIWTPLEFEKNYGAYRGSLYGLSSNSPWSAFNRPSNRCEEVEGLYFVGGSTHPGGGIPLVLLSAKMVSNLVQEDLKVSA